MEWQFCLNWPALIEEAKQRRYDQRLTQAQLAALAGVSTPTISHFENGEKNIQLATIISILAVLGMNDTRQLVFTEQQPYHDPYRKLVIFTGQDGSKVVCCRVSEDVLIDYFSSDKQPILAIFQQNNRKIKHELRRKYLLGQLESDGSIWLTARDLEH